MMKVRPETVHSLKVALWLMLFWAITIALAELLQDSADRCEARGGQALELAPVCTLPTRVHS